MSGELAQWFSSSALERERGRALDKVDLYTDIAIARLGSVVQVTNAATLGVSMMCQMKNQCQLLSPTDADTFLLITMHGAAAAMNIIDSVGRR